MSETTTSDSSPENSAPFHDLAFWQQPPEAIGEYFAQLESDARARLFPPNDLRQIKWLLDTIGDELKDEDTTHYLRALGLKSVPTYVVRMEEIDDATGGELTEYGWEGFIERVTGEEWPQGTVGRHVPTLGMNLFHGPSYAEMANNPIRSVVTHENVHANGLLFDFLNEGIAMALEFAQKRAKNPDQGRVSLTPPTDLLSFGLITVTAMGHEHPEIFKQMLQVLRQPDAEAYTTLVSMLLEKFGAENVLEMARFKPGIQYNDFPDFMKRILPEKYLNWDIPIDGIMPTILNILEEYEKRTGYSFGIKRVQSQSSPLVSNPEQTTDAEPGTGQSVLAALRRITGTMREK